MKPVVAVTALMLVLGYVWERVEVVEIGYRIEQLKVKKATLERQRDELALKVLTLTAPERIARVAVERLGMIPPQAGQVRLVRLQPETPRPGQPPSQEIRVAKQELARLIR